MYSATQVRYLIRESLLGLARRRISGTVAILIMGSSLLTLALFSLVTINLDRVLHRWRGDIDITVYIEDGLTPAATEDLQGEILSIRGIDAVYHVSKAQALEEFRQSLGDDATLLDVLDENPVPASFLVQLSDEISGDAERVVDLTRLLGEYPGVYEVQAQVELVRFLDRMTRLFVIVDLVVGALVLISALFVISNTVRLTVEERARSIEIMKQVGATNWFIRFPFLLSGALQGAAAGLLAMALLLAAHRFLSQQFSGVFFFGLGQIFGFVILSTLLGALGSGAALRRHLTL